MGIENFHPDVIARAAPKVMPQFVANDPGKVHPHDPGAYERVCNRQGKRFYEQHERAWLALPWTYDKVADYASTLDFVGQAQLGSKFAQFLRDEQAEVDRRYADPVCQAEDQLARLERSLREAEKLPDGMSPQAVHERTAKIKSQRAAFSNDAKKWLDFTRERLEPWRIEGERQVQLQEEKRAEVERQAGYVAEARARLEEAKKQAEGPRTDDEAATQAAE